MVDPDVPGDSEHPGPLRLPLLAAGQPSKDAKEELLRGVLGVRCRQPHPAREAEDGHVVALEEVHAVGILLATCANAGATASSPLG
jgi:hypothetical protein